MNIFVEIGRNEVFLTTISAWIITQGIKVCLGVIQHKHFDFRWFVGTGGMPSSHSAGAMAMAWVCGMMVGFDSVLFGIALLVALVTMFDAQGVRREAGIQAVLLNKIVDDLSHQKKTVREDRLKELIGHTQIEVLVGALIGIAIAVVWHYVFFRG